MDESEISEIIEQNISEGAGGSSDGQSFQNRSADDLLKLIDRTTATDALAGTNSEGGPKSAWSHGYLRTARVRPPGSI